MKIGMILLLLTLYIGIAGLFFVGYKNKNKVLKIISATFSFIALIATVMIFVFYW